MWLFDMLRFWKYGLYAFLRFALFKERRSSRRREGFHTAFEGKEGRVQIKTGREVNINDPKNYR